MYFCQSYFKPGAYGWKYAISMLPACSVLIAVFIMNLTEWAYFINKKSRVLKLLSMLLLIYFISISIFNYSITSAGMPELKDNTLKKFKLPVKSSCGWPLTLEYCPYPPTKDHWTNDMITIIEYFNNIPECKKSSCKITLINSSLKMISESKIRFLELQNFPDSKLSFSYIKTTERLGPNLNWIYADYLISIPGMDNYYYSNAVNSLIHNKKEPFTKSLKLIEHFNFSDEADAYIYKISKPISYEITVRSIKKLNIKGSLRKKLINDITSKNH